jgi:hypothetical protein
MRVLNPRRCHFDILARAMLRHTGARKLLRSQLDTQLRALRGNAVPNDSMWGLL